jgi:type IV secretory pathway VirD2 relaxase
MTDQDDFRIRPGRGRSTRAPKTKSFINQVLRAAKTAGHVSGSSRSHHISGLGRSSFGRGRISFSRSRLFRPTRRVIVKARIVRHSGRAFRSAPMSAHLAYLTRDGVTRDDAEATLFDAENDKVDDRDFAKRCHLDRHHFRFIISPEDAADMTDLRAYTRDLVQQMEKDLGTGLEWVAVDHWNTDNPHVHLLVRGEADDGSDLVISRDYISRGLRSRAEDLVGIELGPKPEHEIRTALEREVTAERWTRLDQQLRFAADETGHVDLRPVAGSGADRETRRLMVGRCQHLQKMGLAYPVGPGQWVIGLEAERTLRDLGLRRDVIKTMHKALSSRGNDRAVADYCIDEAGAEGPIIGRLVGKGLHDELTGEAYVVIDASDGRVHHVRLKGVDAFEHAPPIGGLVELRRFGAPNEVRPTLVLMARSDLDLDAQIGATGATWLDHRLVDRNSIPLAMSGFGQEVRDAMTERTNYLVADGFARRQGTAVVFQRDMLNTLRRREVDGVAAKIAAEIGCPFLPTESDIPFGGIYRKRLALASGRFAMIDTGLGFQLVPWSKAIENSLGQRVTGVTKADGGIDWQLGRARDLGR